MKKKQKELHTTTIKTTADTSYIKFGKGKYKISNEIAPNVFVDISTKGKMIGIEVIRKHSISMTTFEGIKNEH